MSMHGLILLVAGLALAAVLVGIIVVDFRRMTIPDPLNLALAASGLSFQMLTDPGTVPLQLMFAATTILVFWTIRRGHLALTGRIGLGLGDVKMFGASALWISPLLLPVLIFVASASALLFVGGRVIANGPMAARSRMPFGPFIALGLGCAWILEQTLGSNLGML